MLILSVDVAKGTEHDFKLYKNSEIILPPEVFLLADSGYQGIEALHDNSIIPNKKPRNGELSEQQKHCNTLIGRERVCVEHAIRKIKIFRIFSGVYRCRRRRVLLRCSLVAGFHNRELVHKGLINEN